MSPMGLGLGLATFLGSEGSGSLVRWTPGDVVAGESFARAGATAFYFDNNGVLQPTVANQKRDSHYIGGVRTLLLEGPATNIVVSPRDLTNGAWVHTTMTPAKDQTGIDGVLNSASSILATGANATSLQSIVLASSTRSQQCWVKRLIGVGAVSMTMDNVTFTAIAVTGAWTKVTIPSQAALVNPTVGFKLAVSGDKIAVDFVDNETGLVSTSPKIGTRNVDIYNFPFPVSEVERTFYAQFFDLGTSVTAGSRVMQAGGAADPRFLISEAAGNTLRSFNNAQTSPNVAAGAVGLQKEVRGVVRASGITFLGISVGGGGEAVSADSAAPANLNNYSAALLNINSADVAGNSPGFGAFTSIKVLSGNRSLAEMRAAA